MESYLKQSLEDLQLDYVDLYLIHHPVSLKETDLPFTLDENGLVYLDCETDILSLWHVREFYYLYILVGVLFERKQTSVKLTPHVGKKVHPLSHII